MIVTFEDPKTHEERDFEFDMDEMDLNQADYIKRTFQLTPLKLQEGLDEADPSAMRAIYWLMCKQNGITINPLKVNFKLGRLVIALNKAAKAEKEAREAATGEGEDPTEGEEPETT
jgi:hypothetical protein